MDARCVEKVSIANLSLTPPDGTWGFLTVINIFVEKMEGIGVRKSRNDTGIFLGNYFGGKFPEKEESLGSFIRLFQNNLVEVVVHHSNRVR